ncbi:cellulose synthase subunit BcsC-related outer membrane protein [Trinickia dinghuensis]|uniref:cellulose synthase subunit BcsC-related outer membrane protein n=1 Tax=Trinickia dinghuensis TaxID=2291023 RepID=UPI001FE7ACFA|nr:cellulose synthase subunit BcsC-related outer membrane protein [Trinickia dinghuensis]
MAPRSKAQAHRGTLWVLGCCFAAPIAYCPAQAARAAQNNVLTIERRDAAPAGETGAGETEIVRRHAQGEVNRSTQTPGASRIVRTEQRNFVDTEAGAMAPTTPMEGAPADIAASATANTANAAAASMAAAPNASLPVPDERPLWRALHDHRLADYDRQLARIEHEAPSWRPSPALVAERARQQQASEVAAALQSYDAAAIRLAIARVPDAFSCEHIDRVWQAADVFAQTGHLDEVDALYRTVIPACAPEANRIATLYRAEHQLSRDQADTLIALEASQGHRDAQGEIAFERLRYAHAIAALGKLSPASPETASQLARVAPSIRAYRDGPAAALAGWIAHAQHDRSGAQNWFESALTFSPNNLDATLGLAQVRIETHDYDGAQSLLDAPALRDDPRARQGSAQIALARANDAYKARRYNETLKWLDVAEQEGMPATATAGLRGWRLYAIGRYEQAAAAFRVAYDARHDDDTAEGLALSIHAMCEHGVKRPTGDGRIDAYLDAIDAQTLYYRKQFVASHTALRDALTGSVDPQRIARYVPADLTGIDAPSLTGGLTWSDHIGAAGQGRLDTIGPEVQGEWFHGTAKFLLQHRLLFINAGTASLDQTAIGGLTLAEELQATMATSTHIGALPKMDWRLSFGGTQGPPSGFEPNFFGSVRQQTAWGMWSLNGGWQPVRDSLLSWRGISTTGPGGIGIEHWGAVNSASGGGQLRWQVAPRWNLSAGAETKWLTGTNVPGNEGMSVDLSAGYDAPFHGFDYFSVGPAVHYLSYRRNENFYSFGQGGYYSPQSSVSAGVALQWLTTEGRNWQVRGSVEGGVNDTLQHGELCGSPGTAVLICAGSHDKGPYASTEVAAVVKLSSRVQIGAHVDANVTPGRDKQFGAAIFVRYFFEPRTAVFSTDLPSSAQ